VFGFGVGRFRLRARVTVGVPRQLQDETTQGKSGKKTHNKTSNQDKTTKRGVQRGQVSVDIAKEDIAKEHRPPQKKAL
jgi:hypothetical protein